MHEHLKGHALESIGNKGMCPCFLNQNLHVTKVCVLTKHGRTILCLTQGIGEAATLPGTLQWSI